MHNEHGDDFSQGIKLKNLQQGKDSIKNKLVLYVSSIVLFGRVVWWTYKGWGKHWKRYLGPNKQGVKTLGKIKKPGGGGGVEINFNKIKINGLFLSNNQF